LQAGDDMILKRMKRRHMRDDAIRFCERDACAACGPRWSFGADIIAGFPTETEAMFENTLKLRVGCGLTFLHVFPYSRPAPARRRRGCREERQKREAQEAEDEAVVSRESGGRAEGCLEERREHAACARIASCRSARRSGGGSRE
jgi:threonylcarbamoyladenosine tRNA methylthiotransferase MtaB